LKCVVVSIMKFLQMLKRHLYYCFLIEHVLMGFTEKIQKENLMFLLDAMLIQKYVTKNLFTLIVNC